MRDHHLPSESELKAGETACPPGWTWVATRNSKGQVLEEGWKFNIPPSRYDHDGLNHLPAYIERLLATQNWFDTIIACTLGDENPQAISLWNQEGQISINEFFSGPEISEAERMARDIASQMNLTVCEEYRTENSALVISWKIPKDPVLIHEVAKRFAIEVKQIPINAGLEISVTEHPDQRGLHQNECGISIRTVYPIQDPTAPPPV